MIQFSVFNAASNIDGTGVFANQRIPARRKIGNLGGEVISLREARKRAAKTKRVAMVEFGNGYALDASINPNALRYLNHSCQPNCYMRCINNRVEFWSLRPIKKGEELTCNYGPTHHDGKLPCRCGASNCVGYL
ncbi:SET domain-containing protein [Phnomibacter ginsenosidimutans]|uniref:SET domain-containing protein-lysine N-methyltransferase n=1 Tax=Phnomibacter ginsenosidimutans TaxID=2676868 RepID=A0A6I6GQ88_9BACT|nr:SET domain-containing protein-lysine N-methyltransferase [Phnomibacter ginsenosidimutans]QGW29112.1 SET domain-containing protein-lysine N-methyltransferase [Phnomibacter ginsenosidimutans]